MTIILEVKLTKNNRKKAKIHNMIIHMAMLPTNGQQQFEIQYRNSPIHIFWITFNDHNHVLDPNLTNDEMIDIAGLALPFMEPGINAMAEQVYQSQHVGLRVRENNFSSMANELIFHGFTNNAENAIRSVLAYTASFNFNSHGSLNVCEIEFNFICDVNIQR